MPGTPSAPGGHHPHTHVTFGPNTFPRSECGGAFKWMMRGRGGGEMQRTGVVSEIQDVVQEGCGLCGLFLRMRQKREVYGHQRVRSGSRKTSSREVN